MVDAGDLAPILHALFRTAFPGRGVGGQLPARLLAIADPERLIPVCTEASTDGRADAPWSWPMGGGLRLQAFGSTDENSGNVQK